MAKFCTFRVGAYSAQPTNTHSCAIMNTVHMLGAHRNDKKAWGVGAKARLSPPANGTGLNFSLAHDVDRHGQGGIGTDPLDTAPMQIPWTETQASDGALSAELGYGFRLGNGSRNVWTPYVATTHNNNNSARSAGLRLSQNKDERLRTAIERNKETRIGVQLRPTW